MTDKPQLSPIQPVSRASKLMRGFPAHLKDPANYLKIQKFIIQQLASKHSHSDMTVWAGCASCQRRFRERGDTLKKLGFKSPAHYVVWKKIHTIMRGEYEKKPLPKYNEPTGSN